MRAVELALISVLVLCGLHSVSRRRVVREPDGPAAAPLKKVCILLHGLAPRSRKTSCFASARRVVEVTFPYLLLTAIGPNRHGFTFDVVGHSWATDSWANASSCESDDTYALDDDLESLFLEFDFGPSVRTKLFSSSPSRPRRVETAAFESVAAALRVALETRSYDWMLAMRWDVVFYRHFDFSALNEKFFYVAHMCVPQKHSWVSNATYGRISRSSEFWNFDYCGPDFYFAANPTNMALMFAGFEPDERFGVFNATKCKGGHGLVAGRLTYLRKQMHVPVGRYLYHLRDLHYVRDKYMGNFDGSSDARFTCAFNGTTAWGPSGYDPNREPWNDPKRPGTYSRCPPRDVYHDACDT